MTNYYIVGGKAYADIDVLACAVAYEELLRKMGKQAFAAPAKTWNQTIPASIRKWPIETHSVFDAKQTDRFILVDISDPDHLDDNVFPECISEVFDHHYGHEQVWQEIIPEHTHIEKVGACATLIWEQFKKEGKEEHISELSANLLYTAIFANTLDFKAKVTDRRDREAAKQIYPYTNLPADWKALYYNEIEGSLLKDPIEGIMTDTKLLHLFDQPVAFGQIEVFNASSLIEKKIFEKLIEDPRLGGRSVILNVASIQEGKSYLFCNSEFLQEHLAYVTGGGGFYENLMITSEIWLRKEFLRDLKNAAKKSLARR